MHSIVRCMLNMLYIYILTIEPNLPEAKLQNTHQRRIEIILPVTNIVYFFAEQDLGRDVFASIIARIIGEK